MRKTKQLTFPKVSLKMFPLKMHVAWPTKRQLSPYLNAFISCTVFVTAVYSLILLK